MFAPYRNKTVLVTGGHAREMIDGVRCFANHARPAEAGKAVAQALRVAGAEVIYIEAAGNAQALLAEAQRHTVDAVVHAATSSCFRMEQVATQKLKVKSEAGMKFALPVVGNIDLAARLAEIAPLIELPAPPQLHALPVFPRGTGPLSSKKIIITGGPTAEPLTAAGDVLTNLSSGRQAQAIAAACAEQGAEVVYIAAQTARQMLEKTLAALPADVFIGVAAVGDFALLEAVTPLEEGQAAALHLIQNPDILHTVATHKLRPKLVIGFAAETHNLLAYAREKLRRKHVDAICANVMSAAKGEENQVTWVTAQSEEAWSRMSKAEIGGRITNKIMEVL